MLNHQTDATAVELAVIQRPSILALDRWYLGLARYTAASSYPEQKGASHVSPSQLLVHTLNRKGLHM